MNFITSHYLGQFLRYVNPSSVRRYASKTRVVNCFPRLSTIWISSLSSICISQRKLSFFKFWQLSAIRRHVCPLNSCWKENISFNFTKRELMVVLITRHYTYKCIKLMHNKKVFFTNSSFFFIFATRQAN